MDSEWIGHWINDLLTVETFGKMTFEEWMWCPERYTSEQLDLMKELYTNRRREYLFSGGEGEIA